VRWDVQDDQLVFDLRSLAEIAKDHQSKKRNVVSLVGQIYDPLGYLSPVTVTFKILMQSLQSKGGLGPTLSWGAFIKTGRGDWSVERKCTIPDPQTLS
jgi:hypothetical protein